jgi:hypothetical protein
VFSEVDDREPDERQVPPQGKILPLPPRRAPDWLMGPVDGLDGARDPQDQTTDGAPPETLPQPILWRPGFSGPVAVPGFEPALVLPPQTATRDQPGEARVKTDEAAEPEVVAAPARPRRRAPSGVWAPVASSVPVLRSALPAEPTPIAEKAPAASSTVRPPGLPGRDDGLPRVVASPPALAALQEPWWVIMLDTLRTSRPVQTLAVAGIVALTLLAYWMWPRGVGTTSLSDVRHYPSQFDGRTVIVRGRVGDDVFAVGAGWAFYLMQGRDTIVAFTRSQTPTPREVITVKGQVSTGFLDGIPRQALFEDVSAAR